MTPCPSKASRLHPWLPDRVCTDTCARYVYACNLGGGEWMAPKIQAGKCVNHVPKDAPTVVHPSPLTRWMLKNTVFSRAYMAGTVSRRVIVRQLLSRFCAVGNV